MCLIIGVDPGIQFMGVATVKVNFYRPEPFKVVYADTIRGDLNEFYSDEDSSYLRKAIGLVESLRCILNWQEPDWVICEDNYLGKSPSSFKKLVEVMTMIRCCVAEYKNINFETVLPRLTKQFVNADVKGADKDAVRLGILHSPLIDLSSIDMQHTSNHANDAIIIALYRAFYIYLQNGWIEKDPVTGHYIFANCEAQRLRHY